MRVYEYLEMMRRRIREQDLSPTEVAGDYLRRLQHHAQNQIASEVGEEMLQFSGLHVVMTIPAIWPSYARTGMIEAAESAGILNDRPAGKPTFTFVSEPEAAATAVFTDYKENARLSVRLFLRLYFICKSNLGYMRPRSTRPSQLSMLEGV